MPLLLAAQMKAKGAGPPFTYLFAPEMSNYFVCIHRPVWLSWAHYFLSLDNIKEFRLKKKTKSQTASWGWNFPDPMWLGAAPSSFNLWHLSISWVLDQRSCHWVQAQQWYRLTAHSRGLPPSGQARGLWNQGPGFKFWLLPFSVFLKGK